LARTTRSLSVQDQEGLAHRVHDALRQQACCLDVLGALRFRDVEEGDDHPLDGVARSAIRPDARQIPAAIGSCRLLH
jgi:hypothetical protein